MAETRLSKVLIKQQKLDEQGNPVFDEQGNPVYVYTEAPFAADIDDFMVYDDNGAANSVKDFVFGATNPDTFKSIKDTTGQITTDNSMWSKLDTKTKECYQVLDDNKSFWNGLSQASYEETTNGTYLASGTEVNIVNFYGEDKITAEADRKKLVSLGALEDFAKRVSTMGNPNNLTEGNGVAFGDKAKAASNSFAFSGDAEGSETTSFHSQTNEANNVIAFRSQVDSDGAVALDGQVWGADGIAIKGVVSADKGIAIGPGTEASANNQTVIGHYNIPDANASFILGTGTNSSNRNNAMKVINNILHLPKGQKKIINKTILDGEDQKWEEEPLKVEIDITTELININYPMEIILTMQCEGVNESNLGWVALDNPFILPPIVFSRGGKDTYYYQETLEENHAYINFQIEYDGKTTLTFIDSSYGNQFSDGPLYRLLRWTLISHQVSGINFF